MNRTVNVFKLAAGVAGSFGLAATAPFTALMSGIILTRKKNPSSNFNQKEQKNKAEKSFQN